MYLPTHFTQNDLNLIYKVSKENSFVTLVSQDEKGEPFFNHAPVLVERTGDQLKLIGHLSKRNPQISHFREKGQAKILVHGPHTYISPRWYTSGRDVPTWNYVAIHFSGQVKLVEDFQGLTSILKKTVDHFETPFSPPWPFDLPDDLADPSVLVSAITGFEFTVEKIDAKFKLSQNRPLEDRKGVIEGLGRQRDDLSQAVCKLMQNEPKS